MHKEGFAHVFQWEMSETTKIRLSPWARIEGRILVGSKPGMFEAVVLRSQLLSISCPGLTIDFRKDASSTRDGSFVIERAVPTFSLVGREIDHRKDFSGSLYFDHAVELDLRPGQTAKATIGGSGLEVTGRLVGPAEHPISFADAYARGQLRPVPSVPKPLVRPKGLTQEQWIRDHAEWLASDAGKAYHRGYMRAAMMWYFIPVGADGTFTVEDIAPGDYMLRVDLHDPREDPPWGLGELLGTTSTLITIEAPADANNRTVNLGTFDVVDDAARREDMRRATQNS